MSFVARALSTAMSLVRRTLQQHCAAMVLMPAYLL